MFPFETTLILLYVLFQNCSRIFVMKSESNTLPIFCYFYDEICHKITHNLCHVMYYVCHNWL
jgi:hypothetical protein